MTPTTNQKWITLLYNRVAKTKYTAVDVADLHKPFLDPNEWQHRSVFSYYQADIEAFVDHYQNKYEAEINECRGLSPYGISQESKKLVDEYFLKEGLPKLRHFPEQGRAIDGGYLTHHLLTMQRYFPIDIDAKKPSQAASWAKNLCTFLDRVGAKYDLYYSGGKGYHIMIDLRSFAPSQRPTLAGQQDELISACKSFANRIASITGITIDTALYRRHSTIRMAGNRRDDDRHKIYLKNAKILANFDHLPVISTMPRFVDERPTYPDAVDKSGPLSKIWAKSMEWAKRSPPVEILSYGSSKKGDHTKFTEKSIDGLKTFLKAQSAEVKEMGRDFMIQCPDPNHNDLTPSAHVNENGFTHCYGCGGNFSPSQLASWAGISLQEKADHLIGKLDYTKQPDPQKWARMNGRQRLEWYENHKKSLIDVDPSDVDGMAAALTGEVREVLTEGKSAVVRSSVGLGKSWGSRDVISDLGLRSLWLAPTHELLIEAGEHFDRLGGHKHLKKFDEIAPHCHDLEMDKDQSVMDRSDRKAFLGDPDKIPSRAQEIIFRQQERGGTRGAVCGGCPRNPRSKVYDSGHALGDCPFIRHQEEFFDFDDTNGGASLVTLYGNGNNPTPTHRLMPTAHIGLSGPEKIIDDVDVVVIDESAHDVIRPVQSFLLEDLKILGSKALSSLKVGTDYKGENVTWAKVWDAIGKGDTSYLLRLFDVLSLPKILELPGLQNVGGQKSDEILSGLDQAISEARRKGKTKGGGVYIGMVEEKSHSPAVAFLRTLKRGVVDIQKVTDYKGNEFLITKEKRDLSWVGNTPVLILDATAGVNDLDLYSLYFDRDFHDLRYVGENKNTVIHHDPERRWSRSKCRDYLYDDDTSQKPVDDLIAYMSDLEGSIGVISWKGNPIVDDVILPMGLTDPDLCAHYGALRGLDRLGGVDHLVLIGGPSVNEMALKMEWVRMGGSHGQYGRNRYEENLAYDSGYMTDHYRLHYAITRGITDEGRECFDRVITREMIQAVGRARGLRHDVEIHAFCAEDVFMPEFDYDLNPGRCRPKSDIDEMWRLAINTYTSKKQIAKKTGLSYDFVKNALAEVDLDVIRLKTARDIYADLGSWSKVADTMNTSRVTLNKKRKEYKV